VEREVLEQLANQAVSEELAQMLAQNDIQESKHLTWEQNNETHT